MDNSKIGRNETNERTSNNVRGKVSSWLSGIVDEVIRKNPITIQKWVDDHSTKSNLNINQETLETIRTENIESNNTEHLVDQQQNDLDCKAKADEKVETKFWSKESILNKFNKSADNKINVEKPKTSSVAHFKIFGSIKLNEFYSKVQLNKARYDSIKAKKKMSQLRADNFKEVPFQNQELEVGLESGITKNDCLQEFSSDAIQDSFDNSANSNSFFNFNMGEIGRSSTIENDSTVSKVVRTTAPKNINLGSIGRSYSEQNDDDDEDDDNFLLNERSRSYSHVVNERVNNKNINKVSCSLPTFFGQQSMPVSPFYVKGTMYRENSLSEKRNVLLRDSSVQSDSSHCSSVESLLEARKPDPEAILINLGFGPVQSEDVLSKIPKRFLKPSQVRGVDTEAFLRRQQLANHLHDHSVLGYRGLLDPDHILILQRFQVHNHHTKN